MAASPWLPLAGVRVVDLTTNISGPYATMILADLGAEVWKVERPQTGDDGRGMGPFIDGVSCYFRAINRGKRSLSVDLRHPRGREAVLALARQARVFAENFRPGKADELGVGFEAVRAVRPDAVYMSISAFGAGGPEAGRPGYDALLQARSGVMSINGLPGGAPARVGVSLLDMGSALWTALGVLAALPAGEARHIRTSLLETGLAWMAYHLQFRLATGRDPTPQGTRHASFAPYGDFPAADGPLMIGISNDRQFRRLCEVLGRPELAQDPRFATNAARISNRHALDRLLGEIFLSRPAAAWEEACRAADIPATQLQSVSQVLADPQVAALDILDDGLVRLPLDLGDGRPPLPGQAPALGQDTPAALRLAGYDDAGIEALFAAGAVFGG